MGQIMSQTSRSTANDREAWILRLLYAPDETGNSSPIYGKTRIVKGMFLLQRKLEENFGVDAGFSFEPHKYGPFDAGVYQVIDILTEQGKVSAKPEEQHNGKYNGIQYSLTEQGCQEAKELFTSIDKQEQELVKWVKYKQLMRSLGALLSYVYMEYPEMTTESELLS